MIDYAVHTVRIAPDQLVPVGCLLHPHTGELAKKAAHISGHQILLFIDHLAPKTGTGQIKRHIGALCFQNLRNIFICPGSQDADIKRACAYSDLLFFIFPFYILTENLFIKGLSGKFFVCMDHGPDPLLIETDSGVFRDPGSIQHIDEFLRIFFSEHIIETADTVAAGGENNALIVAAHHFLQHALGETADVGMHPDLRLVKIRHIRLDPPHLCSHGLEDLHRSIFTYIT